MTLLIKSSIYPSKIGLDWKVHFLAITFSRRKSSEYLEEKKKRILKKKKRIQRDKIFGIAAIVLGSFIVLLGSLALSISILGLLGIILGVRLLLQTKKQKKELEEKGMV